MAEENRADGAAFSILDGYGNAPSGLNPAAYYQDLNLNTILDRVAAKWDRGVLRYYRYLPATAEDEARRRAVYADVKRDDVCGALTAFVKRMAGV